MPYMGMKNSASALSPGPGGAKPPPVNGTAFAAPLPRRQVQRTDKHTPSSLVMRNVVVDGHRTSVRLEPVIWDVLKGIARDQEVTVHDLVSDISRQHIASGLTTAIRVYVVTYLSARLRGPLSPTVPRHH